MCKLNKGICHVDEVKLIIDPEANPSPYIATTKVYSYPYVTVNEGDIISIGKNNEISFKIIHSPGHFSNSIRIKHQKNKM